MPNPSGEKFEFEFTAGTWTDVTADYDRNQGKSITFGRSGIQSQPTSSTITFRLRNDKGKYTPGLAVLSDGTAAPYFPNVRRRIRVRYSTSAGVRGIWRVTAWNPGLVNGVAGYCVVNASDRLNQLGRVTMAGDIAGEIANDSPIAYWPLNEPVGSTASGNHSGVTTAGLYVSGSGAAVTYGVDGPGVEQGLAVAFAQGKYMGSILNFQRAYSAFTLECWCQFSTVNQPIEAIAEIVDNGGFRHVIATGTGISGAVQFIDVQPGSSIGFNASSPINDGQWHHVVITMSAPSAQAKLYVDGVNVPNAATGFAFSSPMLGVRLSQDDSYSPFLGSIAHVAVYDYQLTAARILAHYNVAQQSGELTSDKVKRFLAYAGLASSEYNVDTGLVTTGTYAQDGADVLRACQDMATTEGPASVLYVANDVVQWRNRNARKPGAPVLTLDAEMDLDRSVYEPSEDDQNLVNRVTVQRATASGTQSTQVAQDTVSIAAEELTSSDVTTYTSSDADALDLAQAIVAAGSTPGFRMNRVAVDLVNSKNNLYSAVWATSIGSRIRVTNLPAAAAPASQIDLIVEGWTETSNVNSFQVVFDTSPADNPPTAIYDDTSYGRLQAEPDCALNAALTSAATTVVIKTPTAPHFTTVSARYTTALDVIVDNEVIGLNSAPGGGSSPQTFTGCTRGKYGTAAAAHASGALVQVYQPATYAL